MRIGLIAPLGVPVPLPPTAAESVIDRLARGLVRAGHEVLLAGQQRPTGTCPIRIESDLSDEQVLFLSDILPAGYMGAEMCDIQDGDVVAVWAPVPWASSPWTAPACSTRPW